MVSTCTGMVNRNRYIRYTVLFSVGDQGFFEGSDGRDLRSDERNGHKIPDQSRKTWKSPRTAPEAFSGCFGIFGR